MVDFLHFPLSNEQFEELVRYLDISKAYVDEAYIINLLWDGYCINDDLAIKIFKFLQRELKIDKKTFIEYCKIWFDDEIDDMSDDFILEEYFGRTSFQDISSAAHYSVEDFEIQGDKFIMHCKNLDDGQYFFDEWCLYDAELTIRDELL